MRREPSGVGTSLSGNSEFISLAQTLFESLRRMARRVRGARAALSPRASPWVGETTPADGLVPTGAGKLSRKGNDCAHDNDDTSDGGGAISLVSDQVSAEGYVNGDGTVDASPGKETGAGAVPGVTSAALGGIHVRCMEDEGFEGDGNSTGGDGDGKEARVDWNGGDNPCIGEHDGVGGEEKGPGDGLVAPAVPARVGSIASEGPAVDERKNDGSLGEGGYPHAGGVRVHQSGSGNGCGTSRRVRSSSECEGSSHDVGGNTGGDESPIVPQEAHEGESASSSSPTRPSPTPVIAMTTRTNGKYADDGRLNPSPSRRNSTDSNGDLVKGHGNALDIHGDSGGGGGDVDSDDGNRGFFSGTAQLALAPDSMLRHVLHPAVAPLSLPGLDHDARDPVLRLRNRPTTGEAPPRRDSARVASSVPVVGNADDLPKTRIEATGLAGNGGDDVDDVTELAEAAEDVAEALPPVMVLESCLLAPLREHCRLTSSSCLGVFVDELGLMTIAGEVHHFLVLVVSFAILGQPNPMYPYWRLFSSWAGGGAPGECTHVHPHGHLRWV